MDAETKQVLEMLAGVVDRNTTALKRVADAIDANAEKNEQLSGGMRKMVAVITGAQRQVGSQLGPVIDRGKKAAAEMAAEAEKMRKARHGAVTRG